MTQARLIVVATAVAAACLAAGTSHAQTSGGDLRPQRSPLVARVETKLGKPLTAEQRQEIGAAAKETMANLKQAQDAFVAGVAKIVELPEQEIRDMLPQVGNVVPGFDKDMVKKLETKFGKPLSAEQLRQIGEVDAAKKRTMGPIQQKFAERVAKVTGLKAEEVRQMLPTVGLENPQRRAGTRGRAAT